MPTFEVRVNCEYVIEVEAKDHDEAVKTAAETSLSGWDESWSQYDAEEIEIEEKKAEK